jgi:uncharacterized membrane protein YeaQ/YmgE (transglycosylase-associated protein family)
MFIAVMSTFLGFVFAILLGLIGAWSAGQPGAFMGIGVGLGLSFFATAYLASR